MEVQSNDMHCFQGAPVPLPAQAQKMNLSHRANVPPLKMGGEAEPDSAVTPL